MSADKQAFAYIVFVFAFLVSTANASDKQVQVITTENVDWGYLNPQRGDKSPGAANLWGDRTLNTETGMLVRFNQGFASPPHIHNISYRGVVIHGLMHNSDPEAPKFWMPTGSYWTQPAGQNHITAANGESNMIYLEIDSGPYLVQPSKDRFDNGEHPINLHASNMVWLTNSESALINSDKAKITYLWQKGGKDKIDGVLIKLSPEFEGKIISDGDEFRGVVVSGSVDHSVSGHSGKKALTAGSYFSSIGKIEHQLAPKTESVIYFRFNGSLNVVD